MVNKSTGMASIRSIFPVAFASLLRMECARTRSRTPVAAIMQAEGFGTIDVFSADITKTGAKNSSVHGIFFRLISACVVKQTAMMLYALRNPSI